MKRSISTFIILLLSTIIVSAQSSWSYTPQNPKPGDEITVVYEAASEASKVEAVVYQDGMNRAHSAEDLVLIKSGKKWTGKIQAGKDMSFISVGFKVDNNFDNNNNEGFTILLYEGDKVRESGYMAYGSFYQYFGSRMGVESNIQKAVEMMDKEFENYPENKNKNLNQYVNAKMRINREQSDKVLQAEIEALLKKGLSTEADYTLLENLYNQGKLSAQSKFIADIKKEKFPNGSWEASDLLRRYTSEKDEIKKLALLKELEDKVASGDSRFDMVKDDMSYYKSLIARSYLDKKDWEGYKNALDKAGVTNKSDLARMYNSAAWAMQKDSTNLPLAEFFAENATKWSNELRKDPKAEKPNYMTQKEWAKNKEQMYAMYADTYAMVLYKLGKYKKGFDIAKETALEINKGESADQNETYALLAQKVLSNSKFLKQLEGFYNSGHSSTSMGSMLKDAYVKQNKSDKGFEAYKNKLQEATYQKIMTELQKSMLDDVAPSFALYNLEGKKTDIADLRGKVVVVDFWATWCGPCIASFPGMQQAVDKYKDDPNVKFVFIDTWESSEDKKAGAQAFITKNKYSFDVWMDDKDEVVAKFKVDGIPTKFVIDKEGKIRFKSVGFSGSADKLVMELTSMIKLAADADKKAF